MPTNPIEQDYIRNVASRQAISDLFARYAHGVDRCDLAVLQSVWWPDAEADFGQGYQNAHGWAAAVIDFLQTMSRTQHMITNLLVTFDSSTEAHSQAYVHAYHEIANSSGALQNVVMGGRYLDNLECRNGEWRLLRRRFVLDWNSNVPSTAEWSAGIYAGLTRHGGRAPVDPFYQA